MLRPLHRKSLRTRTSAPFTPSALQSSPRTSSSPAGSAVNGSHKRIFPGIQAPRVARRLRTRPVLARSGWRSTLSDACEDRLPALRSSLRPCLAARAAHESVVGGVGCALAGSRRRKHDADAFHPGRSLVSIIGVVRPLIKCCRCSARAAGCVALFLAAQAAQVPPAAQRRVAGLTHDCDGVAKGRREPGSQPGGRRSHGVRCAPARRAKGPRRHPPPLAGGHAAGRLCGDVTGLVLFVLARRLCHGNSSASASGLSPVL